MNKEKSKFRRAVSEHFFDFLMLFLAISLGFIVDNYRDDREKTKLSTTLAKDLLTDLASDSIAIDKMLSNGHTKERILDSLFDLVDADRNNKNDTLLYRYSAFVRDIPWFDKHDATIKLLLNSGSLSYFTNIASLAITDYDIDCQKVINLITQEREILNFKIYPFQQTIFHTQNFESYIHKRIFKHRPDLHKWDTESKWLYRNYIIEMKILNREKVVVYGQLMASNIKTANIIRSEYKFN